MLLLFCALQGWGWVRSGLVANGLAATAGTFLNFYEGVVSVGGWPWWSPDFLMGATTAGLLGHLVPLLYFFPFFQFFEPVAALQIGSVVALFFAGCAMFAVVRVLTGNSHAALFSGLAYVAAPGVGWRLAWLGSPETALALVFAPLALLAVARLVAGGSWRAAAGLAAACSALLLTAPAIAALFAPLLVLFLALLLLADPARLRRTALLVAGSLAATLLLAGLPLLPLLNETQWMAGYRVDPVETWRQFFSIQTALGWFDRTGLIAAGAPAEFALNSRGYYIGLIGILVVGAALFHPALARRLGQNDSISRWICGFCWLMLLAQWLAAGPRGVMLGHLHFLDASPGLPDWSIPLAYAALGAQAALIGRLCWLAGYPKIFAPPILAVFFLVPGFRLFSLFPGLHNLPDPSAAWLVGGTMALAAAIGVSLSFLLSLVASVRLQFAIGGLAAVAILFDWLPYGRLYWQAGLSAAERADFHRVQEFLRELPGSGKVAFVSGRHLALLTPVLSGRSLAGQIAFRTRAMLHGRQMEAGAMLDRQSLLAWLRSFGIAHVVFDRGCPDLPAAREKALAEFLDPVLDSPTFAIFATPGVLGPAFIWRSVVRAPRHSARLPSVLLRAFAAGALAVEEAGPEFDPVGEIADDGNLRWFDAAGGLEHRSVRTDAALRFERETFHRLLVHSEPGREGWLVVAEAWHPFWTVRQGPTRLKPFRVLGALMGVPAAPDAGAVIFEFEPPWWYSFALVVGAGCWLVLLAAWPWLPRARADAPAPGSPARDSGLVTPEQTGKILVVAPTFQEAGGIQKFLDALLAVGPDFDVLIVDDASPDGTAAIVRNHPLCGRRVALLERRGTRGLGHAYRDGLGRAVSGGYAVAVMMDADLSHGPADVPRLLGELERGWDLVVGSRYCGGGKLVDWPESRRLLSRLAGIYVQALTGLPLRDPTSGFKAMRVRALQQVDWSQIQSQGYGFQVELHHAFWHGGAAMTEIPITFTERRKGQTKMSPAIAIEAVLRVPKLCRPK